MEDIEFRVNFLKKMDKFVRKHTNIEHLIYDYWLLGIPDEASEEDYRDIAEDNDDYIRILTMFANLTMTDNRS